MVVELHKAGYQKIRISPGLSPSGGHWRCAVTFVDNVADDGFTVRDFDLERGLVATYTTGQGAQLFDWPDAEGKDARQLAALFLMRYPVIAERGIGEDWLYSGWLLKTLGMAERGDLPILYADFDLVEEQVARIRPPPPAV